MSFEANGSSNKLSEILRKAGQSPLSELEAGQFASYLELFLRWNERTNLSSVRDAESILQRHILESILCARALPEGLSRLLDFGSGGGFPGIPIAILHPELHVVLAESQNKKAAFLNEAVRTLGINATVFSDRAEIISERFDCVTMRAVDRMAEAVQVATQLLTPSGWLILMTTEADSSMLSESAGEGFVWSAHLPLVGAEQRILMAGQKG